MKIIAVLSTTVLPLDGDYKIITLPDDLVTGLSLDGIPHYVGHPSTRDVVENFGAIKASTNLFAGLRPGESALCFAIKQGQSSRAKDGFTVHQSVTLNDLTVRVITRLSDSSASNLVIARLRQRQKENQNCPDCGDSHYDAAAFDGSGFCHTCNGMGVDVFK